MKQKPIIFSAPMVRAIQDGRKTQTRRIVKHPPFESTDEGIDIEWLTGNMKCPYGQPGDLLWVREAFTDAIIVGGNQIEKTIRYKATNDVTPAEKWKPSIHMPKWAARIWLEVAGIRVERLQEITEADAVAEGARWKDFGKCGAGLPLWGWSMEDPFPDSHALCLPTARMAFANFINKLHGGDNWNLKPSNLWDDNPWVWVVEFKKPEASAA